MRRAVARLTTFFRTEPDLALWLVLATVCMLVPVWIGRYLPLLDYPGHLGNLFVWRHLSDPEWGFDRYYQLNITLLPYWVQFGIERALATFLGEELAQKLFLSLALCALPLSFALYARQVGRDPRLALLAFPLAWNMNVTHGFLAYVGGLPLLFFALTALDRYAAQPRLRTAGIAIVLGVSLYFSHILIWGTFLCIGGLTALCQQAHSLRERPGRLVLAVLPTLPVFAIGLYAFRYGGSAQNNLPLPSNGLRSYVGAFNTVGGNLRMFPEWGMNAIPGQRDELGYAGVLLGVTLLLLVIGLVRGARDPEPPPHARGLGRVELAFGIISFLFLILPRSLLRPFYWFAINRRLVVLVALFGILLIRGSLRSGVVRRVLLAVAATVALIYPLDIAAHFRRFNARARGFEDVIAEVPRGKRVLPLMMKSGDPDTVASCFNQWGSYLQMRLGGFMVPYFPVEFPLKRRPGQGLGHPSWDRPDQFSMHLHGRDWDYFLVSNRGRFDPFHGVHDQVRLVKTSGIWELWERVPPPAQKVQSEE